MSPFSVITGKAIHDLIHADVPGCIQVVRDCYLAHDAGETVNPASVFLRFPHRPEARIIALPAHLGGSRQLSGIKWIASYPHNADAGLPRASAVLILNECEHGRPFACLEGSIVSAARTAASAVLAAEHLHRPPGKQVRALGVIGNGLIAWNIYLFMRRSGWNIQTVYLFDTDRRSQRRFETWISSQEEPPTIVHCSDAASLIASSELLVLATVAVEPHLMDPQLFAHCPTVLHISLRDLAPEIVIGANNVVDDPAHALTANTSLHLAEQAVGNRSFLTCTLADVLRGPRQFDAAKPIIFSPFGLGILDLAVGRWAYERAVAAGQHRPLEDFFFESAANMM